MLITITVSENINAEQIGEELCWQPFSGDCQIAEAKSSIKQIKAKFETSEQEQ